MKKIKTILISFAVVLSFVSLLPVRASAVEIKDPACKGAFWNTLTFLDGKGKPSSDNLADGLPQICSAGKAISIIINLLLGFAGGVAVLFIILGGFWYMTAAGNSEQAEKGQQTLRNAIIGLVVILMSAVIVRIVTNSLTDIPQGGTAPVSSDTVKTDNSSTGANFDPKIVFANSIIMDSSVRVNGPLNVTGRFDATTVPYLKKLAGGSDPSNCVMTITADGKDVFQKLVQAGDGGYIVNVSHPGPFTSNPLSVTIEVCSSEIATKQVNVVGLSAR